MSKKSQLPPCMIGVGLLGHTWAVSYTHDGQERMGGQCNDGETAVRWHDEHAARGDTARIWRREPNGWREVSRGAASIA
jgi:hypothetical protein